MSIKGSDAIPGNAQTTGPTEMNPSSVSVNLERERQISNQPLPNNETKDVGEDELNFERESLARLSNIETEEESEKVEEQNNPVMPVRVNPLRSKTIKTDFDVKSPSNGDLSKEDEADLANFISNMRSSAQSRQSYSVISGLETPMTDDWIIDLDLKSMITGVSLVARRLSENNGIILNEEIQPINYLDLQNLLIGTGDKQMLEEELLYICKRIIFSDETFAMALKNLPIFIDTTQYKYNAQSIYSILNTYKEKMEKNNRFNVEVETGSDDSQCSTKEKYSIESFENSPKSGDGKSEPIDSEEVDSAEAFLESWRRNQSMSWDQRINACLDEVFETQQVEEYSEDDVQITENSDKETARDLIAENSYKETGGEDLRTDPPQIYSESSQIKPVNINFDIDPAALNFLCGNRSRFSFYRFDTFNALRALQRQEVPKRKEQIPTIAEEDAVNNDDTEKIVEID